MCWLGACAAPAAQVVPLDVPVPVAADCSRIERTADGRIRRSLAARREFQRLFPCPVNGKGRGACPGYVVDHVVPLACGGLDGPENMQWQTRDAARAKDRAERLGCECAKPGDG